MLSQEGSERHDYSPTVNILSAVMLHYPFDIWVQEQSFIIIITGILLKIGNLTLNIYKYLHK
jgi:hypothetical protein